MNEKENTVHTDENATYYSTTKKYHLAYPQLEQDLDADVVIIGGGFSGIHTALELAERGIKKVVVLEARYLGFGGTGRNGGQVVAGIGHDLKYIKKDVGEDGLNTIFELSNLGPVIIRERIEKYDIQADFRSGYAYLGYNNRQAKTLKSWENLFKSVECNKDFDIRFVSGAETKKIIDSPMYSSALYHSGGGHLHSLNLLLGEAKACTELYNVQIFEHSPALDVEYGKKIKVRTAKGSITAEKLVWACDSFINRLEPELHSKTINVFSYQMMTEPLNTEIIEQLSPIRGAYTDIRPILNYFRFTNENRLLFGTSPKVLEYRPSNINDYLQKEMLDVFPQLKGTKIDLSWGGPMACTPHLFPEIGTLEKHPNAFFVQGYSGFGVAPSQIICKVLAEGITGNSKNFNLVSQVSRPDIPGKDKFRAALVSLGKILKALEAYRDGRM